MINHVTRLQSDMIDHIPQFQSDLHDDREVTLKLGDMIEHITQLCRPTSE